MSSEVTDVTSIGKQRQAHLNHRFHRCATCSHSQKAHNIKLCENEKARLPGQAQKVWGVLHWSDD